MYTKGLQCVAPLPTALAMLERGMLSSCARNESGSVDETMLIQTVQEFLFLTELAGLLCARSVNCRVTKPSASAKGAAT